MLIIYNPEKNLFILTILRLAVLINIGVFGVFGKERGVLRLWDYLRKRFFGGGDFNLHGAQKDITKTWATH